MNYSYDIIPENERISPENFTSRANWPNLSKKKEIPKKKPQKDSRKLRRKKQVKQYWSQTQQNAYITFLAQNLNIMKLGLKQRRKYCINIMMREAIKTRNHRQCHSHHQKMIKKYGSLQEVISSFDVQLSQPLDFKSTLSSESQKKQFSQELQEVQSGNNHNKEFFERLTPIIDFEGIELCFGPNLEQRFNYESESSRQ